MNNTIDIDSKSNEAKCITAIKQNNLELFKEKIVFVTDNSNTFVFAYRLLFLLLEDMQEFYFLSQMIEDPDEKYMKLVFEVERGISSGSKKKLMSLKSEYSEFSCVIDCLLIKMDEVVNKVDEVKFEKEKNIEMIENCLYVLENYNKL